MGSLVAGAQGSWGSGVGGAVVWDSEIRELRCGDEVVELGTYALLYTYLSSVKGPVISLDL